MKMDFVSELKKQLGDEDLSLEQKIHLINSSISNALNKAALQTDGGALTRLKSQLYHSGVMSHCAHILSLDSRRLKGNWTAASTLAQLTSSCVGFDPGKKSKAFHRLFLPSVMDGLLSLASQLIRQAEGVALFRKVIDSVAWLLQVHTHLTTQVLSSAHYEEIQMSDDVTVSLLCVQMWTQICTVNRNFLSSLTDDSILLLLNEVIGQLAVSSDVAVGAASVKLILIMANQLQRRLQPLFLNFKGLGELLDKDWRGRGFDQDVDQLIDLIQPDRGRMSPTEVCAERVRAACLIQAAWRSYKTRRRVKSLNRAVGSLQRRYRARRKQQQQQKEAQKLEEELKYQVVAKYSDGIQPHHQFPPGDWLMCVRLVQARRAFHQKQRYLLQLLPADQVQSYLHECEHRAAVVIQSFWRGFRERRRYNSSLRDALARHRAARTLQRVARRFLERRRRAKAPPTTFFWIGQNGLTDSRRAELKAQVEEYVAVHRSSRVSQEQCERLHVEVQLQLQSLQRGAERAREEQRREALLAHTCTQLEMLRDAPPLSAVTPAVAESFLSPSGPLAARAREAHNAVLQSSRLPWWFTLGEPQAELDPQRLQELGMEFGGLFVGGQQTFGS